jgi:hypothetical protein
MKHRLLSPILRKAYGIFLIKARDCFPAYWNWSNWNESDVANSTINKVTPKEAKVMWPKTKYPSPRMQRRPEEKKRRLRSW